MPNLDQNRRFLWRMTLKFDGWPWKTIGHLSYATASLVHHFITICEFKLELQSGNGKIGVFSSVTLTFDLWPCRFAWASLLPLSPFPAPQWCLLYHTWANQCFWSSVLYNETNLFNCSLLEQCWAHWIKLFNITKLLLCFNAKVLLFTICDIFCISLKPVYKTLCWTLLKQSEQL